MFGLFKKGRQAGRRPTSLRHRLGIERLETRALLSTAALVGSELVVTGTKGDDYLQVWMPELPPAGGATSVAVALDTTVGPQIFPRDNADRPLSAENVRPIKPIAVVAESDTATTSAGAAAIV